MTAQSIRIREYRSQDFDQLWLLDQQCFPSGIAYSRFELMYYIRGEGAFTLIAEDVASDASGGVERAVPHPAKAGRCGATPLGFVVAESGRRVRRRLAGDERQGRGHIITIDVSPAVRRRGVGSRLMAGVEKRFVELGCYVSYLETAVNNQAAIDFYARWDYRVMGTIPRYYDGRLDALVMAKKLDRSPVEAPPQR